MGRDRSVDRADLTVLGLIAFVKLVFHLATSQGYGIFRDELYYIACSERLAFGYVDHPPLSIVLLWLARRTLGDSLLAIRFLAAVRRRGERVRRRSDRARARWSARRAGAGGAGGVRRAGLPRLRPLLLDERLRPAVLDAAGAAGRAHPVARRAATVGRRSASSRVSGCRTSTASASSSSGWRSGCCSRRSAAISHRRGCGSAAAWRR